MVSNTALINALRSIRYEFKRQADRVMLYKQAGSTRRVEVRRRDWHTDEYARTVLRQAGMSHDDIERFMRTCNQ